MEFTEVFWKKVRFILLFFISIVVLYVTLVKVIFKVPVIESKELLSNINNSEKILKEQEKYIKKVRDLHDSIKVVKFEINQVQKLNELKIKINSLDDIYRKNKNNHKYFFGVQSSSILNVYFDVREGLSKIQKNNKVLEINLSECKANI